ncbi:MAG: type II toxin-antitoxin system HicB family antitoxin [Elusimicrobiota bacterium]
MRKKDALPENAYVRKVFFSPEDKCWVALAPEIMGCAAHGDTDAQALKELDVAIRLHLDVRRTSGLSIPKPAAGQENEGRVLLRLPKTLQRSLREAALAEGISVNQYALYLISMAHGQRHPVSA